jgi:hypothetical protein
MLHIARFIERRFPDQAPKVIGMLIIASAIAVAAGLTILFLR